MLALATVVARAESVATASPWTDELTTTEKFADLHRGAAMTIDNEGNAIVTGSYTTELQFAGSYLEATATSAFVAKYDKAGNKKWAAGLNGAATINAITTDAEGNIYAAGVFADVVKILNANGESKQTITGMADRDDKATGFIVKYSKDGEYVASKTITPKTNAALAGTELWDDSRAGFYAKKLVIDGTKLYLSASYKGDVNVDNVALSGKYVNIGGFMFQDAVSMCVLSFNTSDLGDAKTVSYFGAKEQTTTDLVYQTEDVNFDVHDGKVYVGYVACGKEMTLYAGNSTSDVPLIYSGDGTNEHGYILAVIDGNNVTKKVFHSVATDNTNVLNTIDHMVFKNNKLYLVGTFNQALPFDNTISFSGGCDTYAVSLNATTLEKEWAVTSNFEEGDVNHSAENVSGVVIANDGAINIYGWVENTSDHSVTSALNHTVAAGTPTQMEKESDAKLFMAVATNGNTKLFQTDNVKPTEEGLTYAGKYTYTYYGGGSATGVSNVIAAGNTINWDGNNVTLAKAADITLYNVSGMLVKKANNASTMSLDNVASGIYTVKAGKQTIKVVK